MVVCRCSTCKHNTYKDFDGRYYPGGTEVDAPTARAHHYADRMARAHVRADNTDNSRIPAQRTDGGNHDPREVENAILLTTLGAEPSKKRPTQRGGVVQHLKRPAGASSAPAHREASLPVQSPDNRIPARYREDVRPERDAPHRQQDPGHTTGASKSTESGGVPPSHTRVSDASRAKGDVDGVKKNAARRTAELGALESLITLRSRLISNYFELKFESPPMTVTDPPTELERRHRSSQEFLHYRSWLSLQLRSLRKYAPIGDKQADRHLEVMIDKFEKEAARLDNLVLSAWTKEMVSAGLLYLDKTPIPEPIQCLPSNIFDPGTSGLPHYILAALCLVSILHTLAAVARPQIQLVLATFKVVLFGAFTWQSNPLVRAVLNESQSALLNCIPMDIRTALSTLCLEPEIVIFAACPACSMTYPPDPSKPDDPYPHVCSNAETDRRPCGTPLVSKHVIAAKRKKNRRTVYRPLRPFPYRSFKSWLEQLLRRAGVEELLEDSWRRWAASESGLQEDIMAAPGIRKFRGPDGRTLFSVEVNGSLHLVFGMFVDWFNPHGNKAAGKHHSVGAIYLVLLNLPPNLRFRPEYMYLVGIIPGPHEPSLEQINHFLRPLVDELLEFWHSGVYFARTAKRSLGRLIRAAVIPLICDLPALRKTAGFAHHASDHFCSFCRLRKADICNVDRSTWPKSRSRTEHLTIAKRWRDARTQRARDHIFDDHGLRWSELLRLEYWDPTKYALLDTMHNLFLGILKHHCMNVWQLAGIGERPAKVLALQSPSEQKTQLDRVLKALKKFSHSGLKNLRKDYILAVAQYNKIALPDRPEKKTIADALLEQIEGVTADRVESVIRIPPPHTEPVNVYHPPGFDSEGEGSRYRRLFSFEVLDQLRKDIADVVLPSWIEKPPSNFGSSMHGKLKADQWRTVCTIHMPITLVRVWSRPSASAAERLVLKNFIHLVVAVDCATRRRMSAARAALFDENMEAYLKGLRSIYNHTLVPNHHLSLHLTDILLLFGPVRGWWSYPFERYNGMLQRLNTNHKIRDIPATFLRYFYIGANLRWLMSTIHWPDVGVYKDWMAAFVSAFKDATRGTRYTDILSHLSAPDPDASYDYDERQQTPIPRTVYDQLYTLIYPASQSRNNALRSAYNAVRGTDPALPSAGHFVGNLTHEGIKYSTSEAGQRNSFVTFTLSSNRSDNMQTFAGRIESIFYHRRLEGSRLTVEPFLVVKQYKSLSPEHARLDGFRTFPGLNSCLYYDAFERDARVMRLSNIVSHFAMLAYVPEGINRPCVVARSLDRS